LLNKPLILKKKNKRRMRFRKKFLIPFTSKGNKSRMGKGKGGISNLMCKLYPYHALFLLHRVSVLKAVKVFTKLRAKFGCYIKLQKY